MKIDYNKILRSNLLNVFKDVLNKIKKDGLSEGHHLYITFDTTNNKLQIPKWLIKRYPREMTIIIQHEYWNFDINISSFNIGLSFDDIKVNLKIPFGSVISFVDPYANFGLKLIQENNNEEIKKSNLKKDQKTLDKKEVNNIIDFKNYKKN